MDKVNMAEFRRSILNKGKFKQFAISPYASTEGHFQKVLVLSDKVQDITEATHRNKRLALILPYAEDIGQVIKQYNLDVMAHVRVQAPYVGLFDLKSKQKICEVRL